MVESNDSIPLDAEKIYLGGKICLVSKDCSFVQKRPLCCCTTSAFIILVLPDMSLLSGTFTRVLAVGSCSNLSKHFSVFCRRLGRSDPRGSQLFRSKRGLILENLFRLGAVMCMGVTAGAYILTLFAIKYRERVLGLILVSPLCRAPSWTEWFYNKVMSNLLYFYGMCGLLKEILLQRYFSKEVRGNAEVPESDIVQACRRLLDERYGSNVMRFLQAINRRPDLTSGLKRLRCRTLIFVGDSSPFHSEALYMTSKLDRRFSALVEVQACGSMVTEEQPHAMLIPMEYFFMRYGLYRPCHLSDSPRSPLSPSCISPELLSPESMGLKLKPIKTRVSLEV
ncbi:hypothetical protein Goari_015435 [Gossypium aridum]|uniref:Pollen-specific protein SF21 n=1 Tax=Gossypium aridum TaxID=34290 RepID=A0A7J8WGQ6_GOSAI|nr:hypothetical protein [Gossypium aridum]